MRTFKVIKAYEDKEIVLPERGTAGSAGYDLSAAETITVPSMKTTDVRPVQVLIPTGLKVYLEQGEYLNIVQRSSMYKKTGLILSNFSAVIDEDYVDNPDNEGHIFIPLINIGKEDIIVEKGDRLVQGIFQKYERVDEDVATNERIGGLGSTNQ